MSTTPQPPLTSQEHARITGQTAILSVAVAALLIALKAGAWFVSGSVSMLASLADSTLDFAASLFTFFAVRFAATPPDAEHRFGHGKAEAFAGLMQAALVIVSAALVGFEAASRLARPEPIAQGALGLGVLAISIVITLALVTAQGRAAARTGSVATKGDRMHYMGDLGANVAAMVGIACGAFFNAPWVDALAGLAIALWLVHGALSLARGAADHLLDHELPEEMRARITALALADSRIAAVHDLRTRSSGPYAHVQFHADLDPTLTLEAAHAIIVAAEGRIRAAFPQADVIIHPDPRGRAEPHGHEHFERRTQAG